jgi:RNA polymerase sigma factor (sigma-70 family)
MCESPRPDVDEWVRRYYQTVFRRLRRATRSMHDAEDVTQTAFERVLRHIRSGGSVDDPLGYLLKTAYRVLREQRGALARWEQYLRSGRSRGGYSPSPEQAASDGEQAGVLMGAFRTLPEKYRHALIFIVFEDMSYDEAAAELGVPRNTAAIWRYRGLVQLREKFGDTSPPPGRSAGGGRKPPVRSGPSGGAGIATGPGR